MAHTTHIQFLGLILFVTNNPMGLQAILPHADHHQAFIAYPTGSNPTIGPPGRAVGHFTDAAQPTPQDWEYILLDGETISFEDEVEHDADQPTFLVHMNDDCCRIIGTVRESYKPGGLAQAANVFIHSNDIGWSVERDRIDTIIDLQTDDHSSDYLVIKGVGGNQPDLTLTFHAQTPIVIGNFNLSTIGLPTVPDEREHFKHYYEMLTFGWLCNATIELGSDCGPHFSSKKKPPLIITNDPTTTTRTLVAAQPRKRFFFDWILKKFVPTFGVEISCSNSQYP